MSLDSVVGSLRHVISDNELTARQLLQTREIIADEQQAFRAMQGDVDSLSLDAVDNYLSQAIQSINDARNSLTHATSTAEEYIGIVRS